MDIKDFTRKIKELPTISGVANQINLSEKNKTLTAKSLSDIISRDPALTTKVLKLANSAYYGLVREVTTLNRAVTVLGFEAIKNLALTASVFQAFTKKEIGAIDLKGLWYHSLGTAVAAKVLCNKTLALLNDKTLAEQAFLCGIIHDIGKIAMLRAMPDAMTEVFRRMQQEHIPQHEAEKEIIGFNHQRAGQALADLWNFPAEYLKVIRQHHAPATVSETEPKTMQLVMAVYIGNKIAKALRLGNSTDPLAAKITADDLRKMGISSRDLPQIITIIREDYDNLLTGWQIE